MKLEINLADREEIAAASSLLQLLLANTGGAAEPTPLPVAPSVAAVPVPPTAPVAPEVSLAQPTSETLPPAPPVPVAVAPMVPVAPIPPASGVELDTKGLPWDERIHSSSKAKIASGEWKAKRGINDPVFVANVEAELRGMVAAGVSVPEAMDTLDPAAVFGAQPAAQEVPPPPTPFVPPVASSAPVAPVAPSASADPTTFEQLMPRITSAVMSQILPPTAVGAACTAHGLANVVALQTSPVHVPLVWATLKQQYPALV